MDNKIMDELSFDEHDQNKPYEVNGQIALFQLQAPEGWDYFLGREQLWYFERVGPHLSDLVRKIEPDSQRMHELKHKGFTPVPADRYPELEYFHKDGFLRHNGLILMERPKAIGDAARKQLDDLNMQNMQRIKNFLGVSEPGDDSIYGALDFNLPEHIKQPSRSDWRDYKKKSLLEKISSFFKRKERHYYANQYGSCGIRSLLFPKTRKFVETIQFRFRFGKYKLDKEEKEVCGSLGISEESYIKEKYKIEIQSIY